jgi:subtilisin family serine protease
VPQWAQNALESREIKRSRQNPVIAPAYQEYFAQKGAETVRVWVFFTDKNLTKRGGFASAAVSVSLTDRSRNRRAKVDLVEPVLADLPVAVEYLRAIESLGAVHRRSSRWLNAASFEIPAGLTSRLANFDFVAEVRPLGGFVSKQPPVDETRTRGQESALSGEYALDYGGSLDQLEQLNVPAVHEQGYSGAGVTLTMIDTGFRKSHEAFAPHIAEGRLLAEYDFVYNDENVDFEDGDWASERNHGTNTWSVAAGYSEGSLYGPAYGANFVLCKTEDVRSETNVEEDNWVAAVEFADSVGTDVISTSLGYFIFDDTCACDYTYEDMDGQTAITSIMASLCDGFGIVLVKSAGNSGPGVGTITAPADAFDILAVGSVNLGGTIAATSSRGPTYDGRIKPEVCARGQDTWAATATADNSYNGVSGTSFAAPLIGGAVCLLIEAHPDWRPHQVREALKAAGDNAIVPNNTYGWGIPDLNTALQMDPPCCRGKVGNVVTGSDREPNIADVSALVNYLYGDYTPIDCLSEADVNGSAGGTPERLDITIGDISMMLDYLFISYQPLPDCY